MKHIIASLAIVCSSAHAEFFTGNDLLSRIESDNTSLQFMGMGYVLGVHDLGRNALHCSPTGVASGQVRDIVSAYLRSFPARRHLSADGLISDALGLVWPCPKKGTTL